MPLIRFDPFRELDRMFDQAVNQARQPSFPMDAYRQGDTIVVHFDLPGVDPKSIDIEYERQALTVSAERSWRPTEGDQLLAAERVQRHVRLSKLADERRSSLEQMMAEWEKLSQELESVQ